MHISPLSGGEGSGERPVFIVKKPLNEGLFAIDNIHAN